MIPDSIASSPDGQTLRLYVPRNKNGQIGDIALVNGVYKRVGAPLVPRNAPIYTAPSDPEKYRSRAPTRASGSLMNPWTGGDRWEPGPGDRFRVTEIT